MPLKWGWAIDAVCEHLEAVSAGHLNRLLINIPPGMMKSLITGVFWPAWEWGPRNRPTTRVIGSSYSEDYATRDNRRMRDLVMSPWYQVRWGDRVRLTRVGETSFSNDATGFRQGVPFKRLTGGRADRLILDDPHSVDGAESPAERERTVRTFRESVTTRLNDPENTAIIIIMQRLHERDISGIVTSEAEFGYTHLMLPMEYEPERRCVTKLGSERTFEDPRTQDGELLFPERFPRHVVDRDKTAMGSYAAAAQFQQRPAPRGGGMLKVDKMPIVEDYPRDGEACRCWDYAGTEEGTGSDPDYTAGVKVVMKDGVGYIVDIVHGRWAEKAVEEVSLATAMKDTARCAIVLKQEPGSSGKAVVGHYQRAVLKGFEVHASRDTGSKAQRARPFAAAVEAGNVHLVRGPWNDAFLAEARVFPFGAHDDQVDAAVDAWTHLAAAPTFYV